MTKKVNRVGAITIGQSPRADVVPEMLEVLGGEVEFIQAGALDGLTGEEVAGLAPQPGEYVLVTRLRDGSSVKVAEQRILPRLQAQINHVVQAGAEVVALLCTGEFPPFDCPRLLIKPQVVLYHFVAGVGQGKRLGVVIPASEQIEDTERRWRSLGGPVRVEAGSPYADISQLEAAVASLKAWEADLVVLDCIGFTRAMKARAAELAGVPVVLPRTVLARTLAELV